ncbi:MAG: hypothetical protein FK730_14700 [Asgard group archaeon]|nr:hypothetical protein [Asgard group archaeon]
MSKKSSFDSIKNIYLFLDFDDTLFSNDEKRILLEPQIFPLIQKLKKKNIKIIITSRNPPHIVENILEKNNLLSYFDKLVVDFRKKKYHIKQVLLNDDLLYNDQTLILFIDDYLENCQDVSKLTSELKALIFVIQYKPTGFNNLENILSLLLDNNFSKLKKIIYKAD